MADDVTRAWENLTETVERECLVTDSSGKVATFGKMVKITGYSGDTPTVEDVGADTDLAVGVARFSATQGGRVRIALFGNGVVKMLVGTGGATRGAYCKYVSDGVTDVTVGGGTTLHFTPGQFLETAVAGSYAAVNIGLAGPILTS